MYLHYATVGSSPEAIYAMDRMAKIHTTGILKIELGKELFERTGLTGNPIRSGGRKHGKERFCMRKRPK